jgi:hypothetical protein
MVVFLWEGGKARAAIVTVAVAKSIGAHAVFFADWISCHTRGGESGSSRG